MSVDAKKIENSLAKELLALAKDRKFTELNEKLSSKNKQERGNAKSLYVLIHEFDATRLSEAEKDALTKILIQHHDNSQSSSSQFNIDYLLAIKGMIEPCSYLKIFLDPNSPYDLIERLLRCGANASINSMGSNALHHFCDFDKTSLFLKYGCNINSVSASGFGTSVHIMIANEYEKNFFYILEKAKNYGQQFDYTIQDGDGKTILVLATRVLKFEIVRFILADKTFAPERYIDIQDKHGRTALHYACALGQYRIVLLLIEKGANIYITDNKGFTPFHYANNDKEMVRQLLADIEIDPDRHRDAQCNSFTTLLKKNGLVFGASTIVMPADFMKAQGIVASKFKNNSTATASASSGSDYQEMLICQKNVAAYQYVKSMANPEIVMAKMDPLQKAEFKTRIVDAMSSEQRIAFETLAKLLDEQWQLMGDIDISVSEQCLKGHQLIRTLFLKNHDSVDIFNEFKNAHLVVHLLINEGSRGQIHPSYVNDFFLYYPSKIFELNKKTKDGNFQSQCLKQLNKLKDEVWGFMQEHSKHQPLTFIFFRAVQLEFTNQSARTENNNDQKIKHEKNPGF